MNVSYKRYKYFKKQI